jgi:hypothetical protein
VNNQHSRQTDSSLFINVARQFTVRVIVSTVAVTEFDEPLDVPVPVTVIV